MQKKFIADTTGERIDSFLARISPEYSRSFWQKLCENGKVSLRNQPAKSKAILKEGDIVTAELPELASFIQDSLPIIYQDDDVIVINKPAGVLTHAKGAQSHEFTVAEFVRPLTTDNVDSNRPGIVHRLDRDTSGVIIAAKDSTGKRWLQKQFAIRKVKKTYIALVEGQPKEPAAILQLPIERNPKKPQTFRVGSNGKPAETAYETLKQFQNYTLVALKPHTGRTHQLRVHMHYLGCPIVGDRLYGKPNNILGRMFLHASSLELTLPSRERKIFEAPMPEDLTSFVNSLK